MYCTVKYPGPQPENDIVQPNSIRPTRKSYLQRMFSHKDRLDTASSHTAFYGKSVTYEDVSGYVLAHPPDKNGCHKHAFHNTKRQGKLFGALQNSILCNTKISTKVELLINHIPNWAGTTRKDKEKLAKKKDENRLSPTLAWKYGRPGHVIGCGAFGIVRIAYKSDAEDPTHKQFFAVKEFRQRPEESLKKHHKRVTAEFCISSSLHHPNIIATLDLLQNAKGLYCQVMEYCSGGDLYTVIHQAGCLEVVEADCFFKQLMQGVAFVHEMGVAHRDLKPENVLLTQRGAIKITDFGNAECFRLAWETEIHMSSRVCGSTSYIAPEEYVDKRFDARAVDIWASGLVYMTMRTGKRLWRIAQKKRDGHFKQYLEDRKKEHGYKPIEALGRRKCRNVIYSALDPTPERRLTAHQILLSEWVQNVKICDVGREGI